MLRGHHCHYSFGADKHVATSLLVKAVAEEHLAPEEGLCCVDVVQKSITCLHRWGGPVHGVWPSTWRGPALPRATRSGVQQGLRHTIRVRTGPRTGLPAEQTDCPQVSPVAFWIFCAHQASCLLGHATVLSGSLLQVFHGYFKCPISCIKVNLSFMRKPYVFFYY